METEFGVEYCLTVSVVRSESNVTNYLNLFLFPFLRQVIQIATCSTLQTVQEELNVQPIRDVADYE